MADYATRKDIDEVLDVMRSFMHQVSDEFKEVKQEIVDLKVSHDRLLNTVDAFIKRLDEQETENAARDAQFEKLLAWARKVSKKTGIPLENL
jgi:archaellum component FlaC